MHARAFDELAADYDATFTRTAVGQALRAMVWSRLEVSFRGSRRVLELGCGTGEDAVRLASEGREVVAVDSSPQMIHVARRKAHQHGCEDRVEFHCVPMEELGTVLDARSFDGVLSNFGAINCVQNLPRLVADLAGRLSPGSRLIWVVMGRLVPWEWAWYLGRGAWGKAWRRLQRGGVSWRGLTITYPTPSEASSVLWPYFKVERMAPLGIVLPPSYAAAWLERSPRALEVLTRMEHFAHHFGALATCSDHYILEAVRSG